MFVKIKSCGKNWSGLHISYVKSKPISKINKVIIIFLSFNSLQVSERESCIYMPKDLKKKEKPPKSFHVWQKEGNWFHSVFKLIYIALLAFSLSPFIRFCLFLCFCEMERTTYIRIRDPYWQFTLAPTDPATSRSLVLNSRGLQLHILCWSLRASKHLAAPSIASIWHSRSPVAAAEPIALSYCRNAFCKMSIFISPMLSLWQAGRRTRCVN